jgi:hypothetical protein
MFLGLTFHRASRSQWCQWHRVFSVRATGPGDTAWCYNRRLVEISSALDGEPHLTTGRTTFVGSTVDSCGSKVCGSPKLSAMTVTLRSRPRKGPPQIRRGKCWHRPLPTQKFAPAIEYVSHESFSRRQTRNHAGEAFRSVHGLIELDARNIVVQTPGLFPNATEVVDRMGFSSVSDLAAAALHVAGVSFCARHHFGTSQADERGRCIRLAYSGISVDDIREGLGRLADWVRPS